MAHKKKLREGAYRLTYELGRGPDGKLKRGSETFCGTYEEARARMRESQQELRQGTYGLQASLTVGDVAYRFLEKHRPIWNGKTYEFYESTLRLDLLPALGHVKAAELGPNDFEGLYVGLVEAGRSERALARCDRVLRSTFKWGVDCGMLESNPMIWTLGSCR